MIKDMKNDALPIALEVDEFEYPWDEIPEGYDYAATDSDGRMHAYDVHPRMLRMSWFYGDEGTKTFHIPTEPIYCPNWRESLRKRPEVER